LHLPGGYERGAGLRGVLAALLDVLGDAMAFSLRVRERGRVAGRLVESVGDHTAVVR
jgi:hypothetical protein